MHESHYTATELMTIAAARFLPDGATCFVGIGLPSAAANLARSTHAPNVVLIYESGTIGAKPAVLPLSIGDGELSETADTVVSVPEIFRYWLQGGRIDIGFLGGAQIDRFGNLNTTVIGDYRSPKVRLPGAGGASEIATSAKQVLIVLKQRKLALVERLDFVTSSGYPHPERERGSSVPGGRGPTTVITDLGILRSAPATRELVLSGLHPGVTLDQMQAETGWTLKVADKLETTPEPSSTELSALRELYARTAAAHGDEEKSA